MNKNKNTSQFEQTPLLLSSGQTIAFIFHVLLPGSWVANQFFFKIRTQHESTIVISWITVKRAIMEYRINEFAVHAATHDSSLFFPIFRFLLRATSYFHLLFAVVVPKGAQNFN